MRTVEDSCTHLLAHGFSRSSKLNRRHRQSCDRAVRLHQGDARKEEPPERTLPDAGIERIHPVRITVGATMLALFPLAPEGGRSGNLSAMPVPGELLFRLPQGMSQCYMPCLA
jgi:hypothetical protein